MELKLTSVRNQLVMECQLEPSSFWASTWHGNVSNRHLLNVCGIEWSYPSSFHWKPNQSKITHFFLIGVCSPRHVLQVWFPGFKKRFTDKGVKLGPLKEGFSLHWSLGQERREEDKEEKVMQMQWFLHPFFFFLIGLVVWSAFSYFWER